MRRFASVSLSAALLVCLTGCDKPAPLQVKAATGPVDVRVTPVTTRQVQRVVESVGTLFPYDEAVISAELEGKVDKVEVDLGDKVQLGQALVHIADEEQQYVVAQNEAQLRQSLERLGLKDDNDRIKDIKDTAEVRRAQADLLDAEQRYRRLRSLVEQGIGAAADLDQASAHLKAAQAMYDQSIKEVRNLAQQAEQYRANLALQRKKLRDTIVRAPFVGYIKERQVAAGQYVKVNSPLFTLVKTDPIRLRLEVPERMAPWIKTGQVADVSVEAFENRRFSGKVSRISPTVDQSKRTFVVEILLENSDGELKAGSYARAKLPTDKREQIRTIPSSAVVYQLGSNRAYVVNHDVVEARELKLGDRIADNVEVLEGLQPGEKVAVSELSRLDSGVHVSVGGFRKPGE